jgi:hypothetical protein
MTKMCKQAVIPGESLLRAYSCCHCRGIDGISTSLRCETIMKSEIRHMMRPDRKGIWRRGSVVRQMRVSIGVKERKDSLPPHVIMSSGFHNQSDIMLPGKIYANLYVFNASSVDYIKRVSLSVAGVICIGKTCIIALILLHATDGVFSMKACRESFGLHSRADCGIAALNDS